MSTSHSFLPPDESLGLIRIYEPDFIHLVEEALESNGSVTLALDGYRNSKEIVWACLWYAVGQGALVTVVPRVLKAPLPPEDSSANIITKKKEPPCKASGGLERDETKNSL